jgi:hypothetical protein
MLSSALPDRRPVDHDRRVTLIVIFAAVAAGAAAAAEIGYLLARLLL